MKLHYAQTIKVQLHIFLAKLDRLAYRGAQLVEDERAPL